MISLSRNPPLEELGDFFLGWPLILPRGLLLKSPSYHHVRRGRHLVFGVSGRQQKDWVLKAQQKLIECVTRKPDPTPRVGGLLHKKAFKISKTPILHEESTCIVPPPLLTESFIV